MKVLIQRCKKASVSVNKKIIAKISQGLVIFIGIDKDDNELKTKLLAKRVIFGEDMKVELINDGPATFILEG